MKRLKYQRTWTKEPIEVDLLQVDEYGNVKILGMLRTAHTDGMQDMLKPKFKFLIPEGSSHAGYCNRSELGVNLFRDMADIFMEEGNLDLDALQ